jgi:hypothetical protein
LHTPAPGLTTGAEAPPSQSWPTKTEIYLEAHIHRHDWGMPSTFGLTQKYMLGKMSLLLKILLGVRHGKLIYVIKLG